MESDELWLRCEMFLLQMKRHLPLSPLQRGTFNLSSAGGGVTM